MTLLGEMWNKQTNKQISACMKGGIVQMCGCAEKHSHLLAAYFLSPFSLSNSLSPGLEEITIVHTEYLLNVYPKANASINKCN